MFTRSKARRLAKIVATGTEAEIIKAFKNAEKSATGDWGKAFRRFIRILEGKIDPVSIFFGKGNMKLPFVTFSTLPEYTCPGAGDCLNFCYSFKGWRYPFAFVRQCQNTWLIKNRRGMIEREFLKLPQGITLRLYVDGDFDSDETFKFWMKLLSKRPDIDTYGYSKSLDIVEANLGLIPDNYTLNLSDGGRFDGDPIVLRLAGELAVRGRFAAIPVDRKVDYDDPEYHREVREKAALMGLGKVFSCPGRCGSCTGAGHACGARRPDGSHLVPITIAIGIH